MSTKKALLIFVPVIVALLAIMIAVTTVMYSFSGVMNNYFGQGEIISTSTRGEDAVPEYYDGILDKNNLTKDASKAFAAEVNKNIVREGIVLLENATEKGGTAKALPISKSAKVTVFGASVTGLIDALKASGMSVSDKTVPAVSSGLTSSGFDASADYSQNGDAAIVTIYRSYGEGNDAKLLNSDGKRTDLSISSAELELLDGVCSKFDKVIVLVASSNAMEASYLKGSSSYTDLHYGTVHDFSNIRGALWISTRLGDDAAVAVAEVLNGTTNPSGRLTDTYVKNHKNDPTYVNGGAYDYTNGDLGSEGYKSDRDRGDSATNTAFLEMEEGIYSGYRYYETAAYEASAGNYAGFDYDDAVVYPLGYGKSYTNFTMSYEGTPSFDEAAGEFTFKVKVKNVGAEKGKQVVQIYVNAPYTKGGTEKAHVLLAGFAKTKEIAAGEEDTVEITVNRDYICSYDYKTEKCYILDGGDYNFYLSENAHSWADIQKTDSTKCWTYNVANKIVYGQNNKRGTDKTAAVNKLDDETNWKFKDEVQDGTGYITNFSRKDFAATYPTAPKGKDFEAQASILAGRKKFDAKTLASTVVDDIIITDSTATSYVLADMRGLDYDDEKWDDFIDQLSMDKLVEMYSNGNWQEVADTDNGVPRSIDLDGPEGLNALALKTENCHKYQDQILIGSTFNVELASDMGTAIANEMTAYGFTGWYGPGMNLHRSAFCGRNGQYYSEDAMLSGIMAAAEVSACSEGGVICFLKHFAVNIQETNRNANLCTWANEQALREVYLKSWEYYVKEAKMTVKYYGLDEDGNEVLLSKEMPAATGVMTAYNLVGTKWMGSNDAITSEMLRDEWGFVGTSLTDAINSACEYMDPTFGLYSGATDLCLSQIAIHDYDNDYAVKMLQKAAKNVLYNKANSNCLQINKLFPGDTIEYGLAGWQIGIIVAWVIVGVICAGLAALTVVIVLKNAKQ